MSSLLSTYQMTISVSLCRGQRNGGQVLDLNILPFQESKAYFESLQEVKEIF